MIYVHGNNLEQKENHRTKYRDDKSRKYLDEIRVKYDEWKKANLDLKGPYSEVSDDDSNIINKRVSLFNEYKDFIDQQHYAEKIQGRTCILLHLKSFCTTYSKT